MGGPTEAESPPPNSPPPQPPPPYVAPPPATPVVISQQPTTTVVVTTFGPNPVYVYCPNCGTAVVTRIRYSPGALAWLLCFFTFIFVGPLGCCLIPFFIHTVQDIHHFCPRCQTHLGTYGRI
ncbi:unnamed protein product [Calicophoron daubneyi]|uniref:LITAF domain-containing protein n=1 Tax=Calicophoron daubneyi TaxID=300641 RepID=A0AAV2U1F2_CALDB